MRQMTRFNCVYESPMRTSYATLILPNYYLVKLIAAVCKRQILNDNINNKFSSTSVLIH